MFRTDADPRTVDLSIDPSDRPYGSLFGKRPDLINYGQVGFGRLTTPEAWLSTWSGLVVQRRFRAVRARASPCRRCSSSSPATRPRSLPTPAGWSTRSARPISRTVAVRGLHFGGRHRRRVSPTGNELAAHEIVAWLFFFTISSRR